MHTKAQAFLKALLLSSKHETQLFRFLPAELAVEVQNLPLGTAGDLKDLFSPHFWAQDIHYSWFSETISDYPDKVKALFLGALAPEQSAAIVETLSLSSAKPQSFAFLSPFLMDILRKTMQESEILSAKLLPETVLNLLLKIRRIDLFHVADFLGLHDLAADLKQVIDKELLRKIYNALSEQQLHFLHYASKLSVKWASPKLGLLSWDGSKKQLKTLLHYRGLIRLAKAISQEDPSFKWHLLHRLDTGRAKIIQKELYHKQDPSLIPYFKNQVLHIAKRYQK